MWQRCWSRRKKEESEAGATGMSEYLDLYDYRRRVAALYAERRRALEAGDGEERVWRYFRQTRDALFRDHPSSALDEEHRRVFESLSYFPYRPDLRVLARLETVIEPQSHRV